MGIWNTHNKNFSAVIRLQSKKTMFTILSKHIGTTLAIFEV